MEGVVSGSSPEEASSKSPAKRPAYGAISTVFLRVQLLVVDKTS